MNLDEINKQVAEINQRIIDISNAFDALGIKENDLIEIIDKYGRIITGFFFYKVITYSKYSKELSLDVVLYRIKKNMEPGRRTDYVNGPLKIKKVLL